MVIKSAMFYNTIMGSNFLHNQ